MSKFLSILTLILLLCSFFFGDNIVDNFKSSKLVFSTNKIELKMNAESSEKFSLTNNELNTYRQVIIENIGSKPSYDLNILISLDGNIYNYEIFSIEKYENIHLESNLVSFTMPRLTKGADIILKVWMKNGTKDFGIKITDDKEALILVNKNQINNNWALFQILIILLLIPVSLYIFYIFRFIPLKKSNIILTEENKEFFNKNTLLNEEKHELELRNDELSPDENKGNIIDELNDFILKYDTKK